jgi:hypothetical protein
MDADLYLRMLHNNAQFIKVNAWLSGFRLQSLSKTVQHGSNFPKEYESVKQKYLPWIKLSPRRSRLLYICIQTINGNYIRMLINTWMAHGKYWRKWCKENLVVA